LAYIFFASIIIVLSTLTYQRNKVWKNEISLWTDVVSKSPNKARSNANLGMAYNLEETWQIAIEYYTKSIEISDMYSIVFYNRANVYSEILDLENRLQLYKIYKEQGIKMYEEWNKGSYLFTRLPWKDTEAKFSPPHDFSLSNLSESFKKVLESFEEEIPLKEKKVTKVLTLKQRIKELLQKLTQGKDYNLEELVPDKNKRTELVLTFLAILYLVKEDVVKIKQEKNFGSIWISN